MTGRILVAHASKYGATTEIAAKIGAVLSDAGLKVNVLPVDQIYDVTPFTAAVVGSAVYSGSWLPEGVKFLEDNRALLQKIPIWLFSSGPIGDEHSSALGRQVQFAPLQQQIVDRIHPRDMAFFQGALDMERLNFAEKQIVKETQSPIGDFRDWEVISTWAAKIATELLVKPG